MKEYCDELIVESNSTMAQCIVKIFDHMMLNKLMDQYVFIDSLLENQITDEDQLFDMIVFGLLSFCFRFLDPQTFNWIPDKTQQERFRILTDHRTTIPMMSRGEMPVNGTEILAIVRNNILDGKTSIINNGEVRTL